MDELKQQRKNDTMAALRREAQEEARIEFTEEMRAKAKQAANLEMVREFIDSRLTN